MISLSDLLIVALGLASFMAAVLVVGACMRSSQRNQYEEAAAADVAANVRRTARELKDDMPVVSIEARCRIGQVRGRG